MVRCGDLDIPCEFRRHGKCENAQDPCPADEDGVCEICGKKVYFDKPPEYDVCSRCDKHICIECGTPDPINGDSMCKEHKEVKQR